MKYLFLTLILCAISSCSDTKKYNLSDNVKKGLIRVVDSMYEIDQGMRKHFHKIDSSYHLERNSFMMMNKVKDVLGDDFERYKKRVDSNWIVLKRCDSSNTKRLMAITEKYGFPNTKRLGVYKSKAYFIFVHSPRQFFPEIKALILKEYNQGRISEYEKEYIFWHINGRKGILPMSGENGKTIRSQR